MDSLAGKRVAQCWYSSGDYEEIKAAMEDGYKLPGEYAHWLEGAEDREQQVSRNGGTAVRVPFDLAEFKRFCSHFSAPLNADTRAQFAALKADHLHRQSNAH